MKAKFIYNPNGEDAWEEKQKIERNKRLQYHHRYYARHREEIIRRNALWNNSHPERLRELRLQTVWCEACQKNVRKYLLSQHVETAKHQRNMKS